MTGKQRFRIIIDSFMTVLSIVLMGGTFLFPDERVHQILGMTLIALWICHTILNRRWFGSMFKGMFTPYRVVQLVVNLGISLCALLVMTSGLMMAWFVPAELTGGGTEVARTVHLASSHWYFVFMGVHLGMHVGMIFSRLKISRSNVFRVIVGIVSVYGVYAFIARGVWKYMFLLQQFYFFDFERGYVLFAVDYISMLVMVASVVHCIRMGTRFFSK